MNPGRFALGDGPVPSLDEICAIRGALVAITAGPVPVDLGMGAVGGRIRLRCDTRKPVSLVGGEVAGSGRSVPSISGQVPGFRGTQHLLDVAFPLGVVSIPVVCARG